MTTNTSWTRWTWSNCSMFTGKQMLSNSRSPNSYSTIGPKAQPCCSTAARSLTGLFEYSCDYPYDYPRNHFFFDYSSEILTLSSRLFLRTVFKWFYGYCLNLPSTPDHARSAGASDRDVHQPLRTVRGNPRLSRHRTLWWGRPW
jgi:hypothetical protein